jgi:Na+-translocating ferredoxin:NAD+ oxidoreductase RNF subunit RnfB
MEQLITIKKEACILCYACVRICPVKAIKVGYEDNYPEVLDKRCIGCGSCLGVCAPNAIKYRSSIDPVKNILKENAKKAIIVDPALAAEFPDITDYRKFVTMLRKLGFEVVVEAAFGADLVARKYRELFTAGKGKYYLSANCPSVVSYVEKYFSHLTSNLAPIVSPMIATAMVVHKIYGTETKIVYAGACIASKNEVLRYEGDAKIDEVITFTELRELFKEFKIEESKLEYSELDEPLGQKGALFAISNGILQAAGIEEDLLTGKVIDAAGKYSMQHAVRDFEKHGQTIRSHFNIFYDEGCLMGPGMSPNGNKYLRRSHIIKYANKRIDALDKEKWLKWVYEFDQLNLNRTFTPDNQRLPEPSDQKINEILKVLQKDGMSDAGCSICGYESCRSFATAIGQGLARTDMCFSYTLHNRQEYIKNLKITNEKLAETKQALMESEKKARKEQQIAKEASDTIYAMLQKLPSSIVIVDQNLKILQANKSFIEMLGEEARSIDEVVPGLLGADLKLLLPYHIYNLFSYVVNEAHDIENRDIHFEDKLLNISIFTIRKGKIIGAVLRDMYVPEIRREEVIKKVTEVIDSNLAMVQKIGFLLGEGAAETERMLNAIIESHQAPDKGDKDVHK